MPERSTQRRTFLKAAGAAGAASVLAGCAGNGNGGNGTGNGNGNAYHVRVHPCGGCLVQKAHLLDLQPTETS